LGTKYTNVTSEVVERYVWADELRVTSEERETDEGYRERPLLIIDATGVGSAVRDELVATHSLDRTMLKPVIITGGLDENYEQGAYRVPPKSRLLERMQVDAMYGMLKISSGLPLLETLKDELANIRPKIRADQKYLSYEEIRESVHDDMVLAAALAHWGARKFGRRLGVVPHPAG
jgi:hypothetical protein